MTISSETHDPARDPSAIAQARAQVAELKQMLDDTAAARAAWLCRASGGAASYAGRDLVSAHAHLHMTDVHFMAAGEQVLRTMMTFGVPSRRSRT